MSLTIPAMQAAIEKTQVYFNAGYSFACFTTDEFGKLIAVHAASTERELEQVLDQEYGDTRTRFKSVSYYYVDDE